MEEKNNEVVREARIKEEAKRVSSQAWIQSIGYILTALGLVAGLAWNEAIQGLVATLFPFGKNSVVAQFIYAIIITIVVVVVSARLARKND